LTALELAKPEGKVMVAFRGDGRPEIKDLDDDILKKKAAFPVPVATNLQATQLLGSGTAQSKLSTIF